MQRTYTIGYGEGTPVTITIELTDDGRFSAMGLSRHSGGQNLDTIHEEVTTWTPTGRAILLKVREWWPRWHLNDMRAGCAHQRAEKWDERPIDPSKPLRTYGRHFPGQQQDSWNMLAWVRPDEHPDGLLTKPCPVCGYKYGTAWLKEDIPSGVLQDMKQFLSIPEA